MPRRRRTRRAAGSTGPRRATGDQPIRAHPGSSSPSTSAGPACGSSRSPPTTGRRRPSLGRGRRLPPGRTASWRTAPDGRRWAARSRPGRRALRPCRAITIGAWADAVCTSGAGSRFQAATTGKVSAMSGSASVRSSRSAMTGSSVTLGPVKSGSPSAVTRSVHSGPGRASRYRSCSRSLRTTIVSTPNRSAITDSVSGSNHPSGTRRSKAFSRSAVAAPPCSTTSRARYGRSMMPGNTASTVPPQR